MSCTTLLVGKDASYDGSTIIARNEDSCNGEFDPKRFVIVRPEDQPRHYKSVLSHVEIELPDDPLQYSSVPNAIRKSGIWGEAGVNEANVAMSATETLTTNARVLGADPLVEFAPAVGKPGDDYYKPEVAGGIGEEDFVTIVLPYIRTAREGVARLGALLERYGTYEMNGVAFSDVNEIWWLETVGGHHWIARRVPDDCYAAVPNQLGIDALDFDDALSERRNNMCSADLREFIDAHHLNRAMASENNSPAHFDTRGAFGTATSKDAIYNTPLAWYMQRRLTPSHDWAGPDAEYRPDSQDLPWCREPERKVSGEDVAFLMGSPFDGTPYDPYGTTGTAESRHRYRPIGVNRTGHMVCMQIRPYVPEANRALMWISYGCGTFTAPAPFYANVLDTPPFLRDTEPVHASTDSLYWMNRLIAVIADAHWYDTNGEIEQYIEDVLSYGLNLVEHTDASLAEDADALADDGADGRRAAVRLALADANGAMATWLRGRTQTLLDQVLYTSSNLMHNAFRMSDHWMQ